KDLSRRANLGLKIQDDWFKNLFELFERYNFTVDESTPIDVDISIDPEMLGRIFENLLAEINEETQETARKATGSYYTPREIVDYMVTESLKYYLEDKTTLSKDEIESLLSYQEEEIHLSENKKKEVIDAVDKIKIIDPACGSGAFPMGILQKLILILKKVDPDNKFWIEKKLGKIDDPALREVEKEKWLKEKEETNYLRKLGLLRDSIYGVDIQPYATEISRLRAFLTLIVDKHVDKNKENYGVDPLPNLDFKFVTANSLIDVEKIENTNSETNEFFYDTFYNELEELTNEYFYSFDPAKKEKVRQKIEKLINDKVEDKEQEILSFKNSLDTKFDKLSKKQKELEEKYSYEMALWESYKNIFKDKPVEFFNVKYFFPSAKDGFDIVIANPPYIQLQKDGGKLGNLYKDKGFETFDSMGDIYCLFYEKGVELLKAGGILTYISSNKWMRAGYGEKLRRFFLKHEPLLLIDLGPDVFENATVDTSILVLRKGRDTNKKIACKGVTLDKNNRNTIEVFVKEKAFELTYLNEYAKDNEKMGSQWFVGNSVEKCLKEKIERIGKPLKDWDVKIYYGIKTGLNEAFIIDSKKREEILNNCKDEEERKRTEAIIKPILRGRDIGRYYYEWKGLWVIIAKFGFHKYADLYHSVVQHLEQYKDKLKNRGQCRYNRSAKTQNNNTEFEGQHHWLELDNNPQDKYLAEFEKEKVVWQRITKEPTFCLVEPGFFILDSMAFFTGKHLKYLMSLLNSKYISWYSKIVVHQYGFTGYRLSNQYVEVMPIPPITTNNEHTVKQIESLVDLILDAKKKNKNADTTEYERQIDELVCKLYDLTPEEIDLIEKG
ncbi:MAG: N-6 DNA methylase, partial [archaeon]